MAKVIDLNKKRTKKSIVDSLSYDWNKLDLAGVGLEYAKKDPKSPLARMTLEKLLGDIGVADPGIAATLRDPEVIAKAFQNQSMVYAEGLKTQTVEDRLNYHKGTIEGYLGEDTKKLYEKFGDFLGENYLKLQQKIISANHVLEGKEKGVETSEDDVKKAEKTLKKYEGIYTVLSTLEQDRREQLKKSIEQTYQQALFKSIAADDYNKEEKKVVNG